VQRSKGPKAQRYKVYLNKEDRELTEKNINSAEVAEKKAYYLSGDGDK